MQINAKKIQDRGLASLTWLVALLGMRKATELVQAQLAGQPITKYLPYVLTAGGIFGQAASKNKWVTDLSTALTVVGAEASIRSAITDASGMVKSDKISQTVAKALPASSGLGSLPALGNIRVIAQSATPQVEPAQGGMGNIRIV